MTRLKPGDLVAPRVLVDTGHHPWRLPHTGLLHLQFRRFAGCPICTLHLAEVARRHDEIEAAGVQELIVFHSSREALTAFHGSLPFPLVPDETGELYTDFGVEHSLRAAVAPKVWLQALSGLREGLPLPNPEAKSAGLILPVDILVAPSGRVIDVHYGAHPNDQWSVDALLERVRGESSALSAGAGA